MILVENPSTRSFFVPYSPPTSHRRRQVGNSSLSARDLGAVYLGGVSLHGPAAAGQVRELSIGALDHGAQAFRSATAPWLPYAAF